MSIPPRPRHRRAVVVLCAVSALLVVAAASAVFVLRRPGMPLQTVPDFNERGASSLRMDFRDSSTAPKYHRSYTFEIDARYAWLQVRTYGAVVASKRKALSAGFYRDLLRSHQADLRWLARHTGPRKAPACDGGTGYEVEYWHGGAKRFADQFEACDKAGREAAQHADAIAKQVTAIFGEAMFKRDTEVPNMTNGTPVPTPFAPSGRPEPGERLTRP